MVWLSFSKVAGPSCSRSPSYSFWGSRSHSSATSTWCASRRVTGSCGNEIVPLLAQGNFRQVVQITTKSDAAIAQILNYGLARIQAARRRDDIEKAMEESLMEAVPRIEKRTHYLATFANLATLLGLLGTVMGLINAFHAVATVNPAEKPTCYQPASRWP